MDFYGSGSSSGRGSYDYAVPGSRNPRYTSDYYVSFENLHFIYSFASSNLDGKCFQATFKQYGPFFEFVKTEFEWVTEKVESVCKNDSLLYEKKMIWACRKKSSSRGNMQTVKLIITGTHYGEIGYVNNKHHRLHLV